MFTGLVQKLGSVSRATNDGFGGRMLRIVEPELAPHLTLGESVSVNGVCLTVVAHDATAFDFQVGPETVQRTVLGGIGPDDRVNLERSLRVGDSLGGHFVTGHVDTVGRIASRAQAGEWETMWFEHDSTFDDLLVPKGSIAIDGVSLTVVDVEPGRFSVMLIPHTLAHTTLGSKSAGDRVNLEFDLLAKHVKKLLAGRRTTTG